MDWEDAVNGGLFVLVVLIVASIFIYSFSSKTHKGYYLTNHEGQSQIKINWENSPDEVVYRSFNEQEALKVFKELNETN